MKNKDQAFQWMASYCATLGATLSLDGECGIGRDCVGILVNGTYPDYEWYSEPDYERADNNGEVWTPADAYHKHSCVAVLGHGETAETQAVRVATLDPDEYETLPYLQRLTSTTVAIMWLTFEREVTGLKFGVLGRATKRAARDTTLRRRHLVRLTGLIPGVLYTYTWESGIDSS